MLELAVKLAVDERLMNRMCPQVKIGDPVSRMLPLLS